MTGQIRLWGTGTSRTLRPIWVAEELGVAYHLTPMGPRTGETRTAEYTRLNPKQKIPLFDDGRVRLSESVAICRYMIETGPGGGLYRPADPVERARLDDWCCWVYGELDESSLYVMRRHGDLGHIYGAAPGVVASAGEYALRHLKVMDMLLGDREFVMAEGFSLADVLLMSCLDWAYVYGLPIPDRLTGYRARIGQRPAYRRALAVNFGAQP